MEEGVPCKTPAAKLTPPVKKSQDMHDERSKLVNEYACRVLELLGMGHRLFVPRLLAVRSRFLEIKFIVNLPSFLPNLLSPQDSLCWTEVWEVPSFFSLASHNPKHRLFLLPSSLRGLNTGPAGGSQCHSFSSPKGRDQVCITKNLF